MASATETDGGERPACPPVAQMGKVPLYGVRRGPAAELRAEVRQAFDGAAVGMVDGGAVENNGAEGGEGLQLYFCVGRC